MLSCRMKSFSNDTPTTDYEYSDSGSDYSDSDNDEPAHDSSSRTVAEQVRVAFLERQAASKKRTCTSTTCRTASKSNIGTITLTFQEDKALEDEVIREVWCRGRWKGIKFSSIAVAEKLVKDLAQIQDVEFMKSLYTDRKKKAVEKKIRQQAYMKAKKELQEMGDVNDVRSILRRKWLRHVIKMSRQ